MTSDAEIGGANSTTAEKKPTPAEDTPMKKALFWTSNILGLLCGLNFAQAGFLKVIGERDHVIEDKHAPFFSVPPVAIKAVALFGHLNGGVCMIVGICAKIFAPFVKLDEKKANLLETLILMDGIGMCTIASGAVFLHFMMSEPVTTPSRLLLAYPFAVLRFWYNKWTLPEGYVILFRVFAGICVAGFLLAVIRGFLIGSIFGW
jgi:hypothetical protein